MAHASADEVLGYFDSLSNWGSGATTTHYALSHIFWDRKMYNGYPAELVTSQLGATRLAVTHAGPIGSRHTDYD